MLIPLIRHPLLDQAMVQLRSPRGFLQRLHDHDPVIAAVREAWERPIRLVLRANHIPDRHFEVALLIYNALFDPREILDLRRAGLSQDDIRVRLTASFKGAINAWAEA